MSTGIEWCDETWNPVVGCEQVSRGCAHCYAKTLHDMRHKASLAGKQMAAQYAVPFETVQLMPDRLDKPLRRQVPTRYFVNSVSDLFHKDVPEAFIDRVFGVMACSPRHTFLILTKRPARMQEYMRGLAKSYDRLEAGARSAGYTLRFERIPLVPWPIPNVWLGVSVENQRFANERIPLLLQTPAAIRFLSCEPLLGPVSLSRVGSYRGESLSALEEIVGHVERFRIDWVIVGGESGKDARAMDIQWARKIVADCKAVDVAVFVKQMGDAPHHVVDGVEIPVSFGRHGADFDCWEESLRVREFPAAPHQRTS